MSDTLPTELSSCWHVAPQRVTTLTLDEIRRQVDWSGELVSGASPSASAPTHAEPQPTDEPVVVPQAERPTASPPETPATPTTAHPVSPTASIEPSSSLESQPTPSTAETPSASPPENGSEQKTELVVENDATKLTEERPTSIPSPNLEAASESPVISEHTQAASEPLTATIDNEGESIEVPQNELTAESEETPVNDKSQAPAAEPLKPAAVETVSTEADLAPSDAGPIPPEPETTHTPVDQPPQAEAASTEATAADSPPTIRATAEAETPNAETPNAAPTNEETNAAGIGTRESVITAETHVHSHGTSPEPQATPVHTPPVHTPPSTPRGPDSPSSEKQNSRGAPSCPPRSEEVSSEPVTRKRVPHSSHDRDRSFPSRSSSDFEGSPELTLMSIRARTFEPGDYDSLLGYVEQLENVIYQLNVEMGRLRSDSPAATNERELLARRLVELSLENSELKQATQSNPIPFGEDPS